MALAEEEPNSLGWARLMVAEAELLQVLPHNDCTTLKLYIPIPPMRCCPATLTLSLCRVSLSVPSRSHITVNPCSIPGSFTL